MKPRARSGASARGRGGAGVLVACEGAPTGGRDEPATCDGAPVGGGGGGEDEDAQEGGSMLMDPPSHGAADSGCRQCKSGLSSMPRSVRGSASTPPVRPLRRSRTPFAPDSSIALTTRPRSSTRATGVPAVT